MTLRPRNSSGMVDRRLVLRDPRSESTLASRDDVEVLYVRLLESTKTLRALQDLSKKTQNFERLWMEKVKKKTPF